MVCTERPSHSSARARQDSTGSPSSSTVQAPPPPSSQPCFVPVRPKSSRSASRSVLYDATNPSEGSPFRMRLQRTLPAISLGPKQSPPLLYAQKAKVANGDFPEVTFPLSRRPQWRYASATKPPISMPRPPKESVV